MDGSPLPKESARLLAIPRWEFIALVAALMALNALAIDIMLPGLQQIGASLGVENENHRQYVITAYILGFGAPQLLYGPISDRLGRRGPLMVGMVVYVAAAAAASFAPSFEMLLALRFLQGIGAAGTRVIAVSLVRDVFGGRAMAEVMSLVFMVFMIVPVIAPLLGQGVMLFSEWPVIFVLMAAIAAVATLWTFVRLPETLARERRRPFSVAAVLDGFRIVLTNRVALSYTIASTLVFGGLFGFINSAQQIYVGIYGLGVWFPVLFAAVAGMMAVSSFANARLVGRLGMRRLSHGALLGFLAVNLVTFALALAGPVPLVVFATLFTLAMLQFGWIGSNFNAIAMEPLGHVAGTASAVQGFVQTLGGGLIGAGIGQAFDGTVVPFTAGFCLLGFGALALVLVGERGRLFRTYNPPVR
ncbi:MAG: multidrug effflux MFS transporter [Rhizobiaceae bacterium]|nr:MAG: multidrug effflux MFS transporter [Rhizobiaceae bacterium]CAG1015766.1 Bicyclomycin resistance protein [Rhizobiaceae bacterium]